MIGFCNDFYEVTDQRNLGVIEPKRAFSSHSKDLDFDLDLDLDHDLDCWGILAYLREWYLGDEDFSQSLES